MKNFTSSVTSSENVVTFQCNVENLLYSLESKSCASSIKSNSFYQLQQDWQISVKMYHEPSYGQYSNLVVELRLKRVTGGDWSCRVFERICCYSQNKENPQAYGNLGGSEPLILTPENKVLMTAKFSYNYSERFVHFFICMNFKMVSSDERNCKCLPQVVGPTTSHLDSFQRFPGDMLKSLLASKEDADLTFVSADGEEFLAHKLIIMASSPVFRAMLTSGMQESQTGKITLTDMGSNSLKLFLDFVYIGNIQEGLETCSDEDIKELYNAGDKYDIEALKGVVAYGLKMRLKPENAFDYLRMVKQAGVPEIEKDIKSYIEENLAAVLAST